MQAPQEVPFYPDIAVAKYGRELPLLFNPTNPQSNTRWPSIGPRPAEALGLLKRSSRCWAMLQRRRDAQTVWLLAGNYSLVLDVERKAKGHRLKLRSLQIASTRDRHDMLLKGCLLEHHGLIAVTGSYFGQMESQDNFWESGEYVSRLLQLIRNGRAAVPSAVQIGPEPASPTISEVQQARVNALRTFVDSEFAIEEQEAREEPPYTFGRLTALSHNVVYRQFFSVELLPTDHARILDRKPGLLALKDSSVQREPIAFQVADLHPEPGSPIIHLSVERQVEASSFPSSGELVLQALPTLRKVRSEVLDRLLAGESPNRWLLRQLADEYDAPSFVIADAPLPPEKNPPTESQQRAIQLGLSTPDFALVLGPPGTGKTTVIVSWVRQFVAKGLRVLVTSQNNKAVDNVLERLAQEDGVECVRVGSELKISSGLRDMMLDNKARSLQTRLFSESELTVRRLQEGIKYLEAWLAAVPLRDEVVRMKAIWDRAADEWGCWNDRVSAAQVLLDHATIELDTDQRTLETLESERVGLIQKLLAFMRLDKRTRLRRRIADAQARKEAARGSLEVYETEGAPLGQRRDEAKAALGKESGRLAAAEPGTPPEAVVPEVRIPSTLDPASAEAALKRLRALLDATRSWFDKLRTERQQSLYSMLLERVNVVGATCIGINTNKVFRDIDFDVVIVDEAGQIQMHNLIVPLSRAARTILVGDHKQLPPVVQDEVVAEIVAQGAEDQQDLYRKSWFEFVWDAVPASRRVMLDTQFRCPKPISDFVSDAFYDGTYHAGPGMETKPALFAWLPGPMVFVDTSAHPARGETCRKSRDRQEVAGNPLETDVLLTILARAMQDGPQLARQREIGVIVPYAHHVAEVRRCVARRWSELPLPVEELVATVDSFQGQERDLILFAFTRSNRRGTVGFLADWRRLNVAMTRTRRQLIMVGDLSTLIGLPHEDEARDSDFKSAMRILAKTCSAAGCLIDARDVVRPSRRR